MQHSDKKDQPVIVLPLTDEQRNARKNSLGDLSHLATPEQLNAIPDVVRGLYLDKDDKLALLGLSGIDNEFNRPITDKLHIDRTTNQLIYTQMVYVDQDYSAIVEHKSVITHKEAVFHNPNFLADAVASQIKTDKLNTDTTNNKSFKLH